MTRNHRLIVQQNFHGNELAGEIGERWREVTPVWASIEPINGAEFSQGGQIQATVSHKITTERVPDADRTMRLIVVDPDCPDGEPSRAFNVVSVVNVNERNRQTLWMCTEAV